MDIDKFIVNPTTKVLDLMKKVDLLETCDKLEIEGKKSMRKSELKRKIVDHFVDNDQMDISVLELYPLESQKGADSDARKNMTGFGTIIA